MGIALTGYPSCVGIRVRVHDSEWLVESDTSTIRNADTAHIYYTRHTHRSAGKKLPPLDARTLRVDGSP